MLKEKTINWPPARAWMHEYLLQKPGAALERKESWNALLYRLHGKIFALLLYHSNGELLLNVKCDPFISVEFREGCPNVRPGWHMNKLHWLSLHLNGEIPEDMAKELMDISYDLIFGRLPARIRDGLSAQK